MTGNEFRQHRTSMGLTQTGLSLVMQVSDKQVYRWEGLGDKPVRPIVADAMRWHLYQFREREAQ